MKHCVKVVVMRSGCWPIENNKCYIKMDAELLIKEVQFQSNKEEGGGVDNAGTNRDDNAA